MHGLTLRTQIEVWPLAAPFRITGYTFTTVEVLVVHVKKDGCVGRGEAAGVYYKHDEPRSMIRQVEALRSTIEVSLDRHRLQQLLPAGGARNALDCALWDLEAQLESRPAWELAALTAPRPLLTTFTCGADKAERMAQQASVAYASARAIKLKLTGESSDSERIRAVRDARTDVWLGVDANQGFTPQSLERLMPVLVEAQVALIEQPFPVGQERWLDGFDSPISVAADESLQSLVELPRLAGRFDVVNIKLDKCGGLTEALAITRAAQASGFDTMVGNMMGTSLAMAPAFLVGQLCRIVDLDGPVFLKADRAIPVVYNDGLIFSPEALWGNTLQSRLSTL
jgi:L-alanine-DL-glutamate epimerase-like enolase superfamily enzyme